MCRAPHERSPFGSIDSIAYVVDDTTAAVRRVCNERGAPMVLDETKSGPLRTGTLWAFGHHDVTPDPLLSGNRLSGGDYPIGACSGAAERFGSLAGRVIGRYVDPYFRVHVADVGERLGAGLRTILHRYPNLIAEVRGRGPLFGVEVTDPILRDP